MREHMGLFRGKRIDTGEWAEGYFTPEVKACGMHIGVSISCFDRLGFLEDFEVDPDSIGECTGLRDKNGKLIFEGDIVKFKTRTSTFAVPLYVRWYEETAQFIVSLGDGVRSYPMDKSWKYEIIGNAIDNPELIGGEGE